MKRLEEIEKRNLALMKDNDDLKKENADLKKQLADRHAADDEETTAGGEKLLKTPRVTFLLIIKRIIQRKFCLGYT